MAEIQYRILSVAEKFSFLRNLLRGFLASFQLLLCVSPLGQVYLMAGINFVGKKLRLHLKDIIHEVGILNYTKILQ